MHTLTTPGAMVDVVVTEAGIAVNPARGDLEDRLRLAGLPLVDIDTLCRAAARAASGATPARAQGRTVAIVAYRDGTVIDTVPQVERGRE